MFVKALEKNFDARAHRTPFRTVDNEPNEIYELSNSTAEVTVISIADDRCNPNASTHLTFDDAQYRVDLVFKTQDPADRTAATNALLAAGRAVGQELQRHSDC